MKQLFFLTFVFLLLLPLGLAGNHEGGGVGDDDLVANMSVQDLRLLLQDENQEIKGLLRATRGGKGGNEITFVAGTDYFYGDEGKTFLQLVDESGDPITTGVCFVKMWYPDMSVFQEWDFMNGFDEGLHFYDFVVPNVSGVYPLVVRCSLPLLQDFYNATSVSLLEGSVVNGSVLDTWSRDGDYLYLRESFDLNGTLNGFVEKNYSTTESEQFLVSTNTLMSTGGNYDPSKTLLFMSSYPTDDVGSRTMIVTKFFNGTDILFERDNTGNNVNVTVFFVEIEENVTTTHMVGLPGENGLEEYYPINKTVDTSSSFVLPTGCEDDGAGWGEKDFALFSLHNSTHVGVVVAGAVAGDNLCSWQVVEWNGSSVEQVEFVVDGGTTFVNRTITSVDTSRTLVFGSYYLLANNDEPGNNPIFFLGGSTNLTLERFGTSTGGLNVSVSVVELPSIDGLSVNPLRMRVSDGFRTNSTSVTESVVVGTSCSLSGCSSGTRTSGDEGSSSFMANITGGTLRLTRLDTAGDSVFIAQLLGVPGLYNETSSTNYYRRVLNSTFVFENVTTPDTSVSLTLNVTVLFSANTTGDNSSELLLFEFLNTTGNYTQFGNLSMGPGENHLLVVEFEENVSRYIVNDTFVLRVRDEGLSNDPGQTIVALDEVHVIDFGNNVNVSIDTIRGGGELNVKNQTLLFEDAGFVEDFSIRVDLVMLVVFFLMILFGLDKRLNFLMFFGGVGVFGIGLLGIFLGEYMYTAFVLVGFTVSIISIIRGMTE